MSEVIADTHPIDALKDIATPVALEDTMAEAGRKILLHDFIRMLKNDEGSRAGDDIEYVHDMRVAIRRMRSALRLLDDYYKTKPLRNYVQHLRQLARRLGKVRDLDVLIQDLQVYQKEQDKETRTALQATITLLDAKRANARKKLVKFLDHSAHQHFVPSFSAFLSVPGEGVKAPGSNGITPYQVRHVVPGLIHEHLASVRAFDNVLEDADEHTLHALRIEFKRLRYAVDYFADLLGASGEAFIDDLKATQDHLGRLNDVVVAQATLSDLLEENGLDADQSSALSGYIMSLGEEQDRLTQLFPDVWTRFNTRAIQRKLSDALLMLR